MAGEDDRVLTRLRGGDTESFRSILRAQHPVMRSLAGVFVDPDAASEVVDAAWFDWIGDLEGLTADRDMIRTLASRVMEKARERAARDGRPVDLAALAVSEPNEPVLPDSRFDPDQSWHTPMKSWDGVAGTDIHRGQPLREHIAAAIGRLTPPQRAVVILRDVEELPAVATAALVGIEPKLQSILLHRARARLRRAIEVEVGE